MRKTLRTWQSRALLVCVVVSAVAGCHSADKTPGTLSDRGISRRSAKNELRLREAFRAAGANPRLAEYMGSSERSLLVELSAWSECAIVDTLNAELVLSADLGIDIAEETDAIDLATRVCAIIELNDGTAEKVDGGWIVKTEVDAELGQKCLIGIRGTGFLYAASNTIATATHIFENQSPAAYLCVFDYMIDTVGMGVDTFYSDSQVRRILNVPVGDALPIEEWILLQLDEPMEREPLIAEGVAITVGDDVFSLGHPRGLPLKFTGVNDVICLDGLCLPTVSACPAFKTALPLLEFNSGSPVFSAGAPTPLLGLHCGHWGDEVLDYSRGDSCVLLGGWSDCEEAEADCFKLCGSLETRLTHVEVDADSEVLLVNDATTDAFICVGDGLGPILQLEPENERQLAIEKTSAVWVLSCGDREERTDPRCQWLRYAVRPGESWRIQDERSRDGHIPPGTRVVMTRG